MWCGRLRIRGVLAVALATGCRGLAQAPPAMPLATLDVTVVDAAGHAVREGLAAGNFAVLEDGKPQVVEGFDTPAQHEAGNEPARTLFVLDELNDTIGGVQVNTQVFLDMARMRTAVRDFLRKQPPTLAGEVELYAITPKGLEVVAPASRDRDALIKALGKRRPVLPSTSSLAWQKPGYVMTLAALRALALNERTLPGRKNVVWMGRGPGQGAHSRNGLANPDASSAKLPQSDGRNGVPDPNANDDRETHRIHTLTELLLAARMTVSAVGAETETTSEFQSGAGIAGYLAQSQRFAFEGDTSFRALIRLTGGEFLNGNDIDGEMRVAASFGRDFFTLAYRPPLAPYDGAFHRVQVKVTPALPATTSAPKLPGPLLALTRAGYYALQPGGGMQAPAEAREDLGAVVTAALPVAGLHLLVTRVERFAGSDRALFTVTVAAGEVQYDPVPGGKAAICALAAAVVALGPEGTVLQSQLRGLDLSAPAGYDAKSGRAFTTQLPLVSVLPQGTQTVRIALRDDRTGRVGTVDVSREELDRVPLTEPARPALRPRTP